MADLERVMVSSTVLDLPRHRDKVKEACLKLGVFPLMMEELPASSAEAIQESLRLVNQANIYVGIFAHRYGYVPLGYDTSITEMEYNQAVKLGIERLIFIMSDDHPIMFGDVEMGEGAKKIKALKDRLKVENIFNSFKSPEQLEANVIFGLSQYFRRTFEPFKLDGPQQTLFEALDARSSELSKLYFGALMTLGRKDNPDRLAQAAHGLRELMEKLPNYLDLPVEKKGPTLKEKVRILAQRRDKALKNSSSHDGSAWRGEIDGRLQKFLKDADEFFAWFEAEHPTRRQRTIKMLRGLDPSALSLPDPLEQPNINQWNECHDHFQGVSHHTINGIEQDVLSQLSALESFLLDQLAPRTSEDFAAIDELIREGEAGGKS